MRYSIKVIVTMLMVICVIPACKKKVSTYDQFMKNPKQLEAAYRDCFKFSKTKSLKSQECLTVHRAFRDFSIIVTDIVKTSQEFGIRVLNLQTQIGEVEARVLKLTQDSNAVKEDTSKKQLYTDLTNKLKQEQEELNSLQAKLSYYYAALDYLSVLTK